MHACVHCAAGMHVQLAMSNSSSNVLTARSAHQRLELLHGRPGLLLVGCCVRRVHLKQRRRRGCCVRRNLRMSRIPVHAASSSAGLCSALPAASSCSCSWRRCGDSSPGRPGRRRRPPAAHIWFMWSATSCWHSLRRAGDVLGHACCLQLLAPAQQSMLVRLRRRCCPSA